MEIEDNQLEIHSDSDLSDESSLDTEKLLRLDSDNDYIAMSSDFDEEDDKEAKPDGSRGDFLKIEFDEDENVNDEEVVPVPSDDSKEIIDLDGDYVELPRLQQFDINVYKQRLFNNPQVRRIMRVSKRRAAAQKYTPKFKRATIVEKPSASISSDDDDEPNLVIDEGPSTSSAAPKQSSPMKNVQQPEQPRIRRININEIAKIVAEKSLRANTPVAKEISNDELIENIPQSIIIRKVPPATSTLSSSGYSTPTSNPIIRPSNPKLIIMPEEVKRNSIKYVVTSQSSPPAEKELEEEEIRLISDNSLLGYELETNGKEIPKVEPPPPIKYSIAQDKLQSDTEKIAENQKTGREIFADKLVKSRMDAPPPPVKTENVQPSESKLEDSTESKSNLASSSTSRRKSNHVPKVDLDAVVEPPKKQIEKKDILPSRPQDNIDLIECLANYRVLAMKLLEKVKLPELDLTRNTDDLVNLYKILRN